jgi:hypothetical protein
MLLVPLRRQASHSFMLTVTPTIIVPITYGRPEGRDTREPRQSLLYASKLVMSLTGHVSMLYLIEFYPLRRKVHNESLYLTLLRLTLPHTRPGEDLHV